MSKEVKVGCIMMLIAVILLIVITACANIEEEKFNTADYYTEMYYINKGDTLWEIGQEYKAKNDNLSDWISAVKSLNGMTSSGLIAGQYIRIYVAKDIIEQ